MEGARNREMKRRRKWRRRNSRCGTEYSASEGFDWALWSEQHSGTWEAYRTP